MKTDKDFRAWAANIAAHLVTAQVVVVSDKDYLIHELSAALKRAYEQAQADSKPQERPRSFDEEMNYSGRKEQP